MRNADITPCEFVKTQTIYIPDNAAAPAASVPGGATALMMAAGLRRPTMVELLLPAGADPTLKDKQGKKALAYATVGPPDESQEQCIELLVNAQWWWAVKQLPWWGTQS